MIAAEVLDLHEIEPFSFRWPDDVEDFEGGWTYRLKVAGQMHDVRFGVGSRPAYGKQRVHTVTWLDGNVEVEGVDEADDYPATQALISVLAVTPTRNSSARLPRFRSPAWRGSLVSRTDCALLLWTEAALWLCR